MAAGDHTVNFGGLASFLENKVFLTLCFQMIQHKILNLEI